VIPNAVPALPRVQPLYLEAVAPESFSRQLGELVELSRGLVHWMPPARLGDHIDDAVTAVVVPDMSGLAYRMLAEFRALEKPILVITSEFGTVSMWDWEIRDFLRRRGVETVAPTSLLEFVDICRALGVKERLPRSRMLAYQDDLGAGKQPEIFKRFYWWEDECVDDMQRAFGVTIERRSFRALAARAAGISERRVQETHERLRPGVPMVGLTARARAEALRLYLALNDELDETPDVIAAGINCLNESATSPTTPCLAWNLLFEERGLIWGCEADLTSMLTKYLTYSALRVPVIMTNLYPFLMGDAALKHERIPFFPEMPEPENHVLVAHCGFLGVVPQSFATEWTLRPRVLEIVDPNAHAIDARIAEGETTILKLTSTMDRFAVTRAVLTNYAQYENSDCLNGAVLRVADGYRFVENLPSHHAVLATGDIVRRLDVVSRVLGLAVEYI
jgi:L-fucose isomerase-like protein